MSAPGGTYPVTAATTVRALWSGATTLAVAAAVFLLAFGNGTYATDRRTAVGVAVWWAILVAAVVGVRGLRWTYSALAFVSGLAAFAGWTLASVLWASNGEAAFDEFTRAALYLGVVVLVIALARPETAGLWADGLVLGITAVCAAALASRLYPDAVGSTAGISTLPSLGSRLSYPVGYWNALGVMAALGIPLALSSALRARARLARGLFVAAVPVLAAVVYLTSSRGAVITVVVGVAALVALVDRRWAVLGATCVASTGAALSVLVLSNRTHLANGARGAVASSEARSAAVWLAVIVVGTGAVYAAALLLPRPRRRHGRAFGSVVVAVVVGVILVAAASAHPVRRFDEFRRAPATTVAKGDFVQSHLLSASGNGRWQFWGAAVGEFRHRPWTGGGAGSFAEWWTQHGSLPLTVQDAHSLYAETLGELGFVGLALLLAVVAAALVAVVRAARMCAGRERTVVAGAGAAFSAFLVAAGIDWMWETTVVTVLAFACVGLVVASAGLPSAGNAVRPPLRAVVAVVAACAVAAEGLSLLTQVQLGRSQSAARAGAISAALADARSAVRLERWAASPLVQLALVDEQTGALAAARSVMSRAVARDPDGWKLHLIAARLAVESGDIAAARRSLDRARELNPRSPLFAR